MRLARLVIIGGGGFGREMLAWARGSVQFGVEWEIGGFIDDNPQCLLGRKTPAPWLSTVNDYQPLPEDVFICGLGSPAAKKRCYDLITAKGGRFTKVIHRTAVVGDNVEMKEGVALCPYSIVSANNALGTCVAVNLHSSIDHDAQVGDWSQINCHCDLTGGVQVGKGVFVGSSACVLPGVKVGDGAVVGAGAVVTHDVPAGKTVYGVPAKERSS